MTVRKLALCMSIFLLTALLLFGCAGKTESSNSTETPSPSTPAPTDPVPTEPMPPEPIRHEMPKGTPSGNTESDGELRQVGDALMRVQYAHIDLSNFKTRITHSSNGRAAINYELYIHGYATNDSVRISFNEDGTISHVFNNIGKYAKYLPYATAEAVQSAEKQLDTMVGSHTHPDYYYSIDQEGYLCLGTEVILYIENPETGDDGLLTTGCGIDHKHIFPSVRICHYQ